MKTNKETATSFSFLSTDYQQMELYLNRMSQKGWRLKKITNRNLADFEKCQPGLYQYCTDFSEHITQEYIDSCKQQGWYLIGAFHEHLLIFEHQGEPITRLQSDPEIEQDIFENWLYKKECRRTFLWMLFWCGLFFFMVSAKYGFYAKILNDSFGLLDFLNFMVYFLYALLSVLIFLKVQKSKKRTPNQKIVYQPITRFLRDFYLVLVPVLALEGILEGSFWQIILSVIIVWMPLFALGSYLFRAIRISVTDDIET